MGDNPNQHRLFREIVNILHDNPYSPWHEEVIAAALQLAREASEKISDRPVEGHPHEHTTHALRDVIEALPKYSPTSLGGYTPYMFEDTRGEYYKVADVRALVHKAATLSAPVAHLDPELEQAAPYAELATSK